MTLTRPRSIAEMRRVDRAFVSDESRRRGLGYQPRPDDIFISPYAKCGTTWMQQIVHGLRSAGSMEFDEITQAVPWLELAYDMGWDVNADQVAHPRAFKSHLRWNEIPKGGRYIVVMRDPTDAMLSLYRFLDGWRFASGAISLTEFAEYYLTRAETNCYWQHAASWWAERGRGDVLLLSFEGMKADLPDTVARVAGFMGLSGASGHIGVATQQADFAFMKRHADQFDDHLLRAARDGPCGLPADGTATKVDRGVAGHGRAEASPEIRAAFDRRWQEVMTARFGLDSYDELRRELGH